MLRLFDGGISKNAAVARFSRPFRTSRIGIPPAMLILLSRRGRSTTRSRCPVPACVRLADRSSSGVHSGRRLRSGRWRRCSWVNLDVLTTLAIYKERGFSGWLRNQLFLMHRVTRPYIDPHQHRPNLAFKHLCAIREAPHQPCDGIALIPNRIAGRGTVAGKLWLRVTAPRQRNHASRLRVMSACDHC